MFATQRSLVLGSALCSCLAILSPDLRAHGAPYRGPGDVTPPSPGGGRGTGPGGPTTGGPSGPSTPGPGGPATPGPSGPSTGGPAGPAGGRGPTTGGRGIPIEDSLDKWLYWWEFNKDPYIRLKDAIQSDTVVSGGGEFFLGATRKVEARDSLKPSEEQKLNDILPALKKAIDATEQRDINSSCMVAMAKIGKNHPPDFKLVEVFKPRLAKLDQEVSETAALSLGIAALADAENVDLLVSMAKDKAEGRTACNRPEVNDRTRAFSTYALGLIAYSNADNALKARVLAEVRTLLEDEKVSSRNIKVAAINAIGLLNVSTADDAGKSLVKEALDCLKKYYVKNLGAGEQLLQAHVPPAIAKLLGHEFHDPSIVKHYKDLFANDLTEKGPQKRTSRELLQSCVLALGQLCQPIADDKAEKADKNSDLEYGKLLLDVWHNHKDAQTRYFAILALGQIGGEWAKKALIREFDKAGRAIEKPWIAMGMGVFAFAQHEQERAGGTGSDADEEFGKLLRQALLEINNPEAQGAFAVALGLVGYRAAADDLRQMLVKNTSKEDLAGYLCIGLALMDDKSSVEDIRTIVQKSVRKPDLFKQAAIALGKLGDKSAADELQKLLAETDNNLAKLSAIASALGFIGDRRSIEPLKKMLFDESLGELSRAFAAVALGGIADKENLPWNSKLGQNMNYRAVVETLTDKQSGILDIL